MTAAKITLYGNDVCAHDGGAVDASRRQAEAELTEEYAPTDTDTGRLAAGPSGVLVSAPAGDLVAAAHGSQDDCGVRNLMLIVESNSIMERRKPDVFLMVLDFSCEDFCSSLRYMDRADAFVVIDQGINVPLWEDVSRGMWDGKPRFW